LREENSVSDAPTTLQLPETEHALSYYTFERLVQFGTLIVILTLTCAALAFIGGLRMFALMTWSLGTSILVAGITAIGRGD
jgi:hypothetical protein